MNNFVDVNKDIEEIYSEISELAEKTVKIFTERGLKLAAAESCTGGMISAAITAVPGSSAVTEFGLCSYSNRIKHEVLGVKEETLAQHTEYSSECAEEMAQGARRVSGADIAVSTTGVAGPSGGTASAPVGTVFIGVSAPRGTIGRRFSYSGGREEIRAAAVRDALMLLLIAADSN